MNCKLLGYQSFWCSNFTSGRNVHVLNQFDYAQLPICHNLGQSNTTKDGCIIGRKTTPQHLKQTKKPSVGYYSGKNQPLPHKKGEVQCKEEQ